MQGGENGDNSYFPHSESSSKIPKLWKKADIPLFPPANVTVSHEFGHHHSLFPVVPNSQSICAEGHLEPTRTISTSVLPESFPDQAVEYPPRASAGQHNPRPHPTRITMKIEILGTPHSSSKFRIWLPVILFGQRPVKLMC